MWTKLISEQHFRIKDLHITNYFQYTQVMRPLKKHISCGLQEYQENILEPKIGYHQPPSVYTGHFTPMKTRFLWIDAISEKNFTF